VSDIAVRQGIPLDERIIFALDLPNPELALAMVDRLGGEIRFFKVGLELFLAGCWQVVDRIVDAGYQVMLDLKFYDIPATVSRAVAQLNNRGISLTTVHGNDPIIRGAVESRGPGLNILAVTVLTSFDPSGVEQMGFSGSVEDLVLARARRAVELGCDGVVASAQEARRLRKELGDGFLMVTPGIRLADSTRHDDQRRVATPFQAIRDGSDYLVIGRPIRDAKAPERVIQEIKEQIQQGLAARENVA